MRPLNTMMPSKRLVASYIFDWIVIIGIAAVGGGVNSVTPNYRPFSLLDLSISFPYVEKEKIPTWLLFVVSLVIPAGIIFLVCLIFVPGPAVSKRTSKALIWRRKFWEWNTGWMGLGMSLATAFMLTQGMKQLFGKPRPDLLSRCNPNLDAVSQDRLGGDGMGLSPLWELVGATICQQTDKSILDDGFRSFPSGHSSFSWAGLLYLTLFLCSKFAIALPFLPPRPYTSDAPIFEPSSSSILPTQQHHHHHHHHDDVAKASSEDATSSAPNSPSTAGAGVPLRNQAAAPPTYSLVIALIPVCTAIYISSTRYSDFRHHGFDILFGSFIGVVCAYFSFRWYHLPIQRGAGWSWGARSRDRAWGVGVGVMGYVGGEGWSPKSRDRQRQVAFENGREEVAGPGVSGAEAV